MAVKENTSKQKFHHYRREWSRGAAFIGQNRSTGIYSLKIYFLAQRPRTGMSLSMK